MRSVLDGSNPSLNGLGMDGRRRRSSLYPAWIYDMCASPRTGVEFAASGYRIMTATSMKMGKVAGVYRKSTPI